MPKFKLSKEQELDVLDEYLVYGKNSYKIADTYGVSKGTICSVLKRHGYPTNSKLVKGIRFIYSAQKIFDDRYDYRQVKYVNNKTKVIVICDKHGPFCVQPKNHLCQKSGCAKCGLESRTKTCSEFIDDAIKVHGHKYDYSFVNYTHVKTPVTIICSIHGEFPQTPMDHLAGCSCPYCRESNGESKIALLLDKLEIEYIREWFGFEDNHCINPVTNRKLRFDFYLPNHNMLIEYHGRQHYEFIEFLHRTEERFKEHQERDEVKKQWSLDNNIKLVEIPYNSFENIEDILHCNIN